MLQADVRELRREGATMTLYVSVVLLAELAGLSAAHVPHGWALVALIWATAAGLAIAHWFSFTVAAKAVGHDGNLSRQDVRMGGVQVGAAVVVAMLTSLPVLILGDANEAKVAVLVPAVLIGLAGVAIGRAGGQSNGRALLWGAAIMGSGLVVVGLKTLLGH